MRSSGSLVWGTELKILVSVVRFRPGPPRNSATPIDSVSWGFLMPVLCGTMAECASPLDGGDVESCLTVWTMGDKRLETGRLE